MTNESKEQALRNQVNAALWYAFGDIEPTEPKMERAVNAVMIFVEEAFSRGVAKGKVEGIKEGLDMALNSVIIAINTNKNLHDDMLKMDEIIQGLKK